MQASDGDLEKGEIDSNSPETTVQGCIDHNLVDWDGPEDPQKPVNWPAKKKWTNIILLSSLTMLTYVGPTRSLSSFI